MKLLFVSNLAPGAKSVHTLHSRNLIKLLLVSKLDRCARTVRAITKYFETGKALGHEVAVLGEQNPEFSSVPYSLDVTALDYVVFNEVGRIAIRGWAWDQRPECAAEQGLMKRVSPDPMGDHSRSTGEAAVAKSRPSSFSCYPDALLARAYMVGCRIRRLPDSWCGRFETAMMQLAMRSIG